MPHSTASPSEVLQEVLERARRYCCSHNQNGALEHLTYFTDHPVAPLNRKRVLAILQELDRLHARKGRPLAIMDVACGGGLITSAIYRMGHCVVGVDIDETAIQFAQMFQPPDTNICYLALDLINAPEWESLIEKTLRQKPDVVLLAYALHHLTPVEVFIRRLSEWVQPGTIILINEENPWSPIFRLKHILRTIIQRDTQQEHHRNYHAWKSLLEKYHFSVTPPRGLDLMCDTEGTFSQLCWSIIFEAYKLPNDDDE